MNGAKWATLMSRAPFGRLVGRMMGGMPGPGIGQCRIVMGRVVMGRVVMVGAMMVGIGQSRRRPISRHECQRQHQRHGQPSQPPHRTPFARSRHAAPQGSPPSSPSPVIRHAFERSPRAGRNPGMPIEAGDDWFPPKRCRPKDGPPQATVLRKSPNSRSSTVMWEASHSLRNSFSSDRTSERPRS